MINEEEQVENYTNEQLRNWLKKNDSPRIVVRGRGSSSSITASSGSDKMCALLESSLAKNGFDVRDRFIFENIASSLTKENKTSYNELSKATDVDLLMEITSYSLADYYYVDGYYINRKEFHKFETITRGEGRHTWEYQPVYTFRGMSLTIKVIMLKDNLLGGSYSYSYIPCNAKTGGALITNMYPLRYIPNGESRDLDAIADDENGRNLMETRSTKMDRAMENFISTTVVPSIIRDIRGEHTFSQAGPVRQGNNLNTATDFSNERNSGIKNSSMEGTDESIVRSTTAYVDNYNLGSNTITTEFLLAQYGIESYLKDYADAITAKDKKRAKQIEGELWEIEKKVKSDSSIPPKVRNEFVNTIEKTEDEIEKSPVESIQNFLTKVRNALDKKSQSAGTDKNQDMGVSQSVVAVNTYGKISMAVHGWIHSAFEDKSQATISSLKKEKDIVTTKQKLGALITDEEQLEYLVNSKVDLSDLLAFISISCSDVGNNNLSTKDNISLFLPSSKNYAKNDMICFVFIDKICVGVGSYSKGFYSSIPANIYDDNFHRISIVGINSNAKKTDLHNSSVRFDIKKDYLFSIKGTQLIIN